MEPPNRRPRGAPRRNLWAEREEDAQDRVGWRQSPWRPKCEEEKDEKKMYLSFKLELYDAHIHKEPHANIYSAASSVHI